MFRFYTRCCCRAVLRASNLCGASVVGTTGVLSYSLEQPVGFEHQVSISDHIPTCASSSGLHTPLLADEQREWTHLNKYDQRIRALTRPGVFMLDR